MVSCHTIIPMSVLLLCFDHETVLIDKLVKRNILTEKIYRIYKIVRTIIVITDK